MFQAGKSHVRAMPSNLFFWIGVSKEKVEHYRHPSVQPPLVDGQALGVVGCISPDEQEKVYRYLKSHQRHGLDGFRERFARAIAQRSVVVLPPVS